MTVNTTTFFWLLRLLTARPRQSQTSPLHPPSHDQSQKGRCIRASCTLTCAVVRPSRTHRVPNTISSTLKSNFVPLRAPRLSDRPPDPFSMPLRRNRLRYVAEPALCHAGKDADLITVTPSPGKIRAPSCSVAALGSHAAGLLEGRMLDGG